jgi:4-phospho-D-threonate 3-dehydrogenase / 4-phospho-D-erythronate 3-dehydrogenase
LETNSILTKNRPLVAVTMGDPAGIGPETIIKAFQRNEFEEICRVLVIGDARLLTSIASKIGISLSINSIQQVSEAKYQSGALDVLDLKNVPENLSVGKASREGGLACLDYIRIAVKLAMEDKVDAITTGPINKKGIRLAGYSYPGHTEFLAELTHSDDFALMMVGEKLRVALATLHISLQEVPEVLNQSLIETTIRLTHDWLARYIKSKPKIAVTGLNPHCGDSEIFGKEEKQVIEPAIECARNKGIDVEGPFPADSLFVPKRHSKYDAVVAMYHDQGLIPVKMESEGCAVNLTLGLPIIRTSVDHGTAYDIAGKGVASSDSLINAVQTAAKLSTSLPVS